MICCKLVYPTDSSIICSRDCSSASVASSGTGSSGCCPTVLSAALFLSISCCPARHPVMLSPTIQIQNSTSFFIPFVSQLLKKPLLFLQQWPLFHTICFILRGTFRPVKHLSVDRAAAFFCFAAGKPYSCGTVVRNCNIIADFMIPVIPVGTDFTKW